MGISTDTAFVGILIAALCGHGFEVNQQKRADKKAKRKREVAAAKEERDKKAAAADAEVKRKKAIKTQAKRQQTTREREESVLSDYRSSPLTPADFESSHRYGYY